MRFRFAVAALAVLGCGKSNPFTPVPECKPGVLLIKPLMGDRQMLISSLAIAGASEGFDLNGDGKVDNKLSPLGALANPAIKTAFKFQQNVIVPIELFGYTGADSECTKMAFYLGRYTEDKDMDGHETSWEVGKADCDDTNAMVHPGVMENLTNRMDDDCDGFADNMTAGTPPTDMMDLDGDGQSPAAGDCDDRMGEPIAAMRHKGAKDICGDGIDEDCNGIPDDDPSCDPFADNDVTVHVQQVSFDSSNVPVIKFPDGNVKSGTLTAGPDLWVLNLPFAKDTNIALTLTGAHVKLELVDKPNGTYITPQDPSNPMDAPHGLLGGVLEAVSLAQIHGLNLGGVIKADQSLLDLMFVGLGTSVLGLDTDADGHYLPDIDVDGDGLESFWQENPMPDPDGGAPAQIVDTCKDGDGTIVKNNFDGNGTPCALAKDSKGNYRFVDGLSVALKFTAVPVKLGDIVPK
jgi:hypothetical protein